MATKPLSSTPSPKKRGRGSTSQASTSIISPFKHRVFMQTGEHQCVSEQCNKTEIKMYLHQGVPSTNLKDVTPHLSGKVESPPRGSLLLDVPTKSCPLKALQQRIQAIESGRDVDRKEELKRRKDEKTATDALRKEVKDEKTASDALRKDVRLLQQQVQVLTKLAGGAAKQQVRTFLNSVLMDVASTYELESKFALVQYANDKDWRRLFTPRLCTMRNGHEFLVTEELIGWVSEMHDVCKKISRWSTLKTTSPEVVEAVEGGCLEAQEATVTENVFRILFNMTPAEVGSGDKNPGFWKFIDTAD